MKVQEALDYANSYYFPELIFGSGYEVMEAERLKGEDAMKTLDTEWRGAAEEPFSYDLVRELGDRNRAVCDAIGETRLRNLSSSFLARGLTDEDLCAGIGALQKRAASAVAREVRGDR